MKPTFDTILDVIDDRSLQSEEKAAKLLTLFESFSSKVRRLNRLRESFDGEQLQAVRRAMQDGRWRRLDEICVEAGYPVNSIGAISARIRELPEKGVRYEKRKANGSRLYEYRLLGSTDVAA